MKTLLFFLVIGFSLCTAGKAQTSLVSTREKFRHHEISVSYGFLPITDANILFCLSLLLRQQVLESIHARRPAITAL